MNKKIIKSITVNFIIVLCLIFLFVEFKNESFFYLLEAYLILKSLSLVLGVYYCHNIKHKPITITFVALMIAAGGLNLAWIFSLAIVYNKYRKELGVSPVLANFDRKVEDYLVD
ncbi:MAG: hypothetical protein PHU71_06250 [Candidatus Gracilibacteria bacterium]|nr:hypothetical protein [Candidatus Gracilibacteria bacterium]